MSLPQPAPQSKPQTFTILTHDILDSDQALDLTQGGYAALVDFFRLWQRESRNGRLNVTSIPFTHSRCRRRISRAAFDRARDELEGAGFIAAVNRRWGHYRWTFEAADVENFPQETESNTREQIAGDLSESFHEGTGGSSPQLKDNCPEAEGGDRKSKVSDGENFHTQTGRTPETRLKGRENFPHLSNRTADDPPAVLHDQPLKRFARKPSTKTLPRKDKNLQSRGSTHDPKVSRGPCSLAEILGGLTIDVMEIVSDIERITGENHWRRWWTATLREIAAAGCLGEFEGWVRYAGDCQSPRQRALKDLGELKKPGPFLVSKALELQRRHGFKWFDYPGIGPG